MAFVCFDIKTPTETKKNDLFVAFTMFYDGSKKFDFNDCEMQDNQSEIIFSMPLKEALKVLIESSVAMTDGVLLEKNIDDFKFASKYLTDCAAMLNAEVYKATEFDSPKRK